MQNQNRCGRPCRKRRVNFNSKIKYFKPQGIPMAKLEIIELNKEEYFIVKLSEEDKLFRIENN